MVPSAWATSAFQEPGWRNEIEPMTTASTFWPRRLAAALFGLAALIGVQIPARADITVGCYVDNYDMRIRGCTELIERGNLSRHDLGMAYASRALGYSMLRRYEAAIEDYDRALALIPNSAMALNNRAWAYYRMGRPTEGENDVERSLRIDPTSAPAYDTRAHIHQALGRPAPALRDYKEAIAWGGSEFITMYQCGLTAQGLYRGPVDGVDNPELRSALAICVENAECDPLPADKDCKGATS